MRHTLSKLYGRMWMGTLVLLLGRGLRPRRNRDRQWLLWELRDTKQDEGMYKRVQLGKLGFVVHLHRPGLLRTRGHRQLQQLH